MTEPGIAKVKARLDDLISSRSGVIGMGDRLYAFVGMDELDQLIDAVDEAGRGGTAGPARDLARSPRRSVPTGRA